MQIIAREVELEVMRRSVPIQGSQNLSKPKKPLEKSKPQNHLQKLPTKTVNYNSNRTKDLVCCSPKYFSKKKLLFQVFESCLSNLAR